MTANPTDLPMQWFALRDLKRFNAHLPAYEQLTQAGFKVFTPMVTRLFTKNGKRLKREVPFIQDLLFVYDCRQKLDPVIAHTPTLQYRYKKGGQYCEPIVIPEREMSRFIQAVQSTSSPQFYSASEITSLMCGRDIRIIGGVLDGLEGKLQTLRGSRTKRLVVMLPTLMAVSVAITDEYIELL